jgi:hypothetical protein
LKQKPPAFQFYVKQWLGDDKVMLMDDDSQGLHIRLMCIAWQQDHPGTIPNEEAVIRRWLRSPSNSKWKRVWPQIRAAWQISKKNPFKLYSRALLREFRKQRAFSNKQKQNIEKRWKNKADHDDTMVLPRYQSGNTRAGNTLQSSSSAPAVNFPHTPQSGASASPKANGNGRRHDGTNPRAKGTNPRAVTKKAIEAQAKAKQYRDPVIPPSEEMTIEEMRAIRKANIKTLPSQVKETLQEIAKGDAGLEAK